MMAYFKRTFYAIAWDDTLRMNFQQPSTDSFAPNAMIIPGSRPSVKEIFLAICDQNYNLRYTLRFSQISDRAVLSGLCKGFLLYLAWIKASVSFCTAC